MGYPEQELTIRGLVSEAYDTAKAKGWHDPGIPAATFGESMALVHSEVSEALEAFRDHGLDDATTGVATADTPGRPPKPEGVGAELADVLIRVGHICGHFGIDLQAEVERKLAYNKTRPHRHGGKRL